MNKRNRRLGGGGAGGPLGNISQAVHSTVEHNNSAVGSINDPNTSKPFDKRSHSAAGGVKTPRMRVCVCVGKRKREVSTAAWQRGAALNFHPAVAPCCPFDRPDVRLFDFGEHRLARVLAGPARLHAGLMRNAALLPRGLVSHAETQSRPANTHTHTPKSCLLFPLLQATRSDCDTAKKKKKTRW